ncbi:hypothetical protein DPK04_18395 [Salmonella enterica subsp. enterica serovar Mikawasima]|jgi:hypothetical protein|nr:hypothetical protein [Salmonella enterica]EAY2430803.1 hypothetical protein [Salmonella enterica]EBJ5587916.1 hypothetical protein [Salmonella enterica]EBS4044629.1 hypothetical protein [Salmonella enterica subsp. enterica serovar Mikawasima]PUX45562.1 hypothetical protein BS424_13515 [Cronobacter sakazakii]
MIMTTVEDLINDVLVNLGRTPDELLIATVFDSLPDDVCRLAKEWGWCDTEVRERVYAVAWKIINN